MEKIELQAGMVTKSLKGHDTDRVYVTVAIVNHEFALVADGNYRKISNPKLKRVKHLKILFGEDKKPLTINDKLSDEKIAKLIKDYTKS